MKQAVELLTTYRTGLTERPAMTAEDWFGVVVRSMGLGAIIWGLTLLPGLYWQTQNTPAEYLGYLGFWIGMGTVIIATADGIVRVAYPRRTEPLE
jgi:hypothetical protein